MVRNHCVGESSERYWGRSDLRPPWDLRLPAQGKAVPLPEIETISGLEGKKRLILF